MARMHTGKHGKAKSRKPDEASVTAEGLDKGSSEIVKEISEYARQGMHQARIGQMLKEKHKVPYIKHALGKRLGAVLEESGFKKEIPQDMLDLLTRAIKLRRHIERNHNDIHNKTSLHRCEAKIWRLSNYYKETGKLPADWKYDPEKVALIIKS